MHSADDLMKLADEAIHAYAAWLAEMTTGGLPSLHVDRLNDEKDAARRKLEAAIRSTVSGVALPAPTQPVMWRARPNDTTPWGHTGNPDRAEELRRQGFEVQALGVIPAGVTEVPK